MDSIDSFVKDNAPDWPEVSPDLRQAVWARLRQPSPKAWRWTAAAALAGGLLAMVAGFQSGRVLSEKRRAAESTLLFDRSIFPETEARVR